MYTFRTAAPGDAPLLGQLRQHCWATTYRGIFPDELIDRFNFAWHELQDLQRIRHLDWCVWLILHDDLPVGYLTMRDSQPPQLQSLYLLDGHRGHGAGTLALDMARQWCVRRNHPYFLLDCHPQNAAAMAFYRKRGGIPVDHDDCEPAWQSSVTFRFAADVLHQRDQRHKTGSPD